MKYRKGFVVVPIQVGQDIMYHTSKKVLPFAFFLTDQAFKNWEGLVSGRNPTKRFNLGHL